MEFPFGLTLTHLGLSLYFLLVGLIVFIMFLSDPDTSDVNRFVTVTFPKRLMYEVEYYFGSKAKTSITSLWDYVVNERNPIMQVMYLVIVLGAFATMIVKGYPHLDYGKNVVLSPYHKYVGYVAMGTCLALFYVCCTSNPGYIDETNIDKYDVYPYDNVLFAANSICKTKKIRKLARSKFDRMSNSHVSKFDHFCGWLNAPVGELNYRYFIAFLAMHSFTLLYGAFACGTIFFSFVVNERLMEMQFYNSSTGQVSPPSPWIIFNYISNQHLSLIGLFLLAGIMGFVVLLFLLFHLTLISLNMTTNEFFKWRDLCKWHGAQQRKHRDAKSSSAGAASSAAKKGGQTFIQGKPFDGETIDYKVRVGGMGAGGGIIWWIVGGGTFGGGTLVGGVGADDGKGKAPKPVALNVQPDREVGCVGVKMVPLTPTPPIQPPASSSGEKDDDDNDDDDEYDKCEDVVLDDANAAAGDSSTVPRKKQEQEQQLQGGGKSSEKKEGEKKKKAKEDAPVVVVDEEKKEKKDPNSPVVVDEIGPMPINIYNHGIFENFKEVFWPRSTRRTRANNHAALLLEKESAAHGGETIKTGKGKKKGAKQN